MRFPRPGRHGGEAWTSIGIGSSNELERLPAAMFSSVLIVWAIAVLLAVLRSMWDQHKEEGLDDKTIHHIAHSITMAKKSFASALDQLHHADGHGVPLPVAKRHALVKSVARAERRVSKLKAKYVRAVTKKPVPGVELGKEALEPALIAPQLRAAPLESQTSGQVTSGEVTISDVRGIIEGFEGQIGEVRDQMRDQIGEVRDMVQALLVAQQKAQALASGGTGGSRQEAQARRRRRHPPSLLEQR